MWPRVADHTEWLFVLIKGAYSFTDLPLTVYIESLKLVLCGYHGNKPVFYFVMFPIVLTEPLMQAIKITVICPIN